MFPFGAVQDRRQAPAFWACPWWFLLSTADRSLRSDCRGIWLFNRCCL